MNASAGRLVMGPLCAQSRYVWHNSCNCVQRTSPIPGSRQNSRGYYQIMHRFCLWSRGGNGRHFRLENTAAIVGTITAETCLTA